MAFCNSCGATLADGTNFCSKCGKPVTPGASPSAATATGLPSPPPSTGGQPCSANQFDLRPLSPLCPKHQVRDESEVSARVPLLSWRLLAVKS